PDWFTNRLKRWLREVQREVPQRAEDTRPGRPARAQRAFAGGGCLVAGRERKGREDPPGPSTPASGTTPPARPPATSSRGSRREAGEPVRAVSPVTHSYERRHSRVLHR